MSDSYKVLRGIGEGKVTEKMSRFLSFAIPVRDADEARTLVKQYQNKYHDSRHVCWAYMIGAERAEWQLNDNGEPSGTAGKPILGQINSAEVTNCVVIVVRYFGGIKLGTPGLIAAYREAAREAITDAGTKEVHAMDTISIIFPYMAMNGVMKVVKSEPEAEVLSQTFDNTCELVLTVRRDEAARVRERLAQISGVTFSVNDAL